MDRKRCIFSWLIAVALFKPILAQTAPPLGTAQSFAILGAAAVTNTGSSIVNGNLGVSPGTSITGIPPGIVNGTIHNADAVAAQAQSDANTAYNSLAGQPCNTILTGSDLGGLTLSPGVYCFASSAQLTGTLTLNAQGNANALFIFKIGSTLTTASNSSVVLVNSASACNVFFQVGSSATLGTGTQFIGSIFALASVTLTTNVTVGGRAIGLNGAVTMDSNVVSAPNCNVVPTTGTLQVCKVAGTGVTVGSNFTFDVAGTPLVVPAGTGPAGTCSTAMVVQAGSKVVTETLPSGIALTSVATSPSGALVSSNLAAGTATVTVTAGGQTVVTFLDTLIPVVPTTGFLQVCKVAGANVAIGTNFTFSVAGTPVIVPAGAAPGGSCSPALVVPAGPVIVTETLPAGIALTSVSTLPAGLLVSSNLAAGAATVTVNAGGQTVATFLDTLIPVIPTTGFLQVCKVAGANIAVGANFTFSVGGTPLTVPAGPAPGGTCGAAMVLPAGPVVVTETLPAGDALTSVTTLPAASLVSSNLAAGTATVTVNAGGQTIVTFLDALIPVVPTTGLLQVCKVAGAGVTVGTNFTFDVAGTPVVVPAGLAPGGSCSTAMVVPAGATIISETLPVGTTLTSVSTLPTGLLVSSNLATGVATVTVNAGGQTIATFVDTIIPVVPTTGFLQICKVAGAGVALATNFTFNVEGTPVVVPAGPAPGGSCSPALVVQAGQKLITETLPAGIALTSVSTLPAGSLVSSDLAGGTASVTVTAGGQTIVTFLDTLIPVIPTTGTLQVCKIAGSGVPVGTNFSFNVAGTTVVVPAGAAPGGSCSAAMVVPAGTTAITETLPSGIALTAVSTLPSGLLVSSNLAAGTASVTVNAGGQTIVTFIDTNIPVIPTTGFLQICKVAGAGVPVGTIFTFNVGGTPITVAAGAAPGGSCSAAIVVPAGAAIITETLPAGTTLSSVSTLPAGLLVSSNLPAGVATVTVNAGGQTIATFLNTIPPITGLLQICKVAGAGVAVGTNFTFNIAGNVITVPAGAGPGGSCSPLIVAPAGSSVITETLQAGTALTSVSTLPAGSLVSSNLGTGAATVTVIAGAQTTATFVNASTTGTLQICKVAGTGLPVGTSFTFNVGGNPITVQAGAGPGGNCSPLITLPAGPAVITETLPTGTALTSVTSLPAGSLVSSNLGTGAATVTVTAGAQTTATFVNANTTGTLQICKVAGTGLPVGTSFTFNVGGNPITVQAGAGPGGNCSPLITLPAGPAVITETLPTGTALTSVTSLPAGSLVSSNLGAGTAMVTVTAGAQTTATFVNANTTGTLQICKVAGTGLPVGTSFTFNVGGNPITVQAGAGPGGNCSPLITLPAGPASITETLPSGTALTSVSSLPAGSLVSSNLGAGTAMVTVTAGAQTTATFVNANTTGTLQICKVAGTGLPVGTSFTFNVGGNPITVQAGAGPGGNCSPLITLPAGPASITETLPSGTILTSVTTLPAGSLVSSNLGAGTAMVTVTAGAQTTATFVNANTTGTLQICKVAGSGVTVGTSFTFNVGGSPITVQAGAGPGGTCSQLITLPAGPASITETLPSGTILTSVTTLPAGSLVSSNLGAGTAMVTVTAGAQTTATFVNANTTGTLQICKVAGSGVTVGTSFTFNVGGSPITVQAGAGPGGTCSQLITLPAGPASITETLPTGTTLASVSTSPSVSLVSTNLAAGTATVTINAGGQTTATFTNQAGLGLLKICKIAGTGVTSGTMFTFTVGSTTLSIPAGFCSIVGSFPVGTPLTVVETIPAGNQVAAIGVLPPDRVVGTPNLTTGTVAITIGTGVTEVDFTNATTVVIGQLRVCKFAGTGVTAGTSFSFVVAGANLTVPAGSCVLASASFPVGTSVTVAETASAGTIPSAIGVIPVDRQGAVNLAAGTVTATIGTGITEVDFTNTATGVGLLKVCKIAGAGIAQGTSFTFTMAGTNFIVPAGFCAQRGTFPIGTVVTITETVTSGIVTSAISVAPPDRQGVVSLATQSVTATIGSGVTEVSFTNVVK